jgi:hypothetical protein
MKCQVERLNFGRKQAICQEVPVRSRTCLSAIGQFIFTNVWFFSINFASMMQHLIIALLFLSAITYLGWVVYRSFNNKSCPSGCAKCSAVDFKKLEADLKSRGL